MMPQSPDLTSAELAWMAALTCPVCREPDALVGARRVCSACLADAGAEDEDDGI